jgi:multiple sugar transport system permease protein
MNVASKRWRNLPLHLVLIAGCAFAAFPFFWMVTTSFKNIYEATSVPPVWFPSVWEWGNYIAAWNAAPFARYFLNTLFIAGCTTVLDLITGCLAGYALARVRFPGRSVIFFLFLATVMIPFELLIVPDFIIINRLNWYNTYTAQIAPFAASGFSIFLLRQFFAQLPNELHEAAIMDGAGHLRFLWQVAVPLSVPALVTTALFNFIASWNAFLWPLIVTGKQELRPVQLGLSAFQTESGTNFQLLMAGTTIVILPVLLVFIFAQRHLIEGIARAGLKG